MPRIPFRRRRTLKERIADKLHEKAEHLTEQASALGEKAEHASSQAAEKAAHSKISLAEMAAHQRAHLKAQGAHLVTDLNSQAADRVKAISSHSPEVDADKLMKEARDVANNAAAVALDFWEKARNRTGSAAHAVPTREQISQQLGLAAQSIEQRSREAQEAARKSAADVKDRVREFEPAVEEKLVSAKERTGEKIGAAREKTGEIAEETADAGKNFGAMLFWLAAAAGIIYFIILDKERREKVLNTTKAVGSEIYEVAQDIRGHDGEFA